MTCKKRQSVNGYSMDFIKILGLVYARRWKKEELKKKTTFNKKV